MFKTERKKNKEKGREEKGKGEIKCPIIRGLINIYFPIMQVVYK